MEFNWSILGWLAGLIFVYIFGLVEGRSQGYKKRKAEESTEKKNETEPKPVTVKVDDPGLLRIKNESGYLTLDLDGARVDTTAFTADQRKRLIEMLNLMRPWLEGRPVAASAPTPPPAAQPKPVAPARPGIPVISTPPASQPIVQPSQPVTLGTDTIA